jgi:enoyl-CoA hydratase/carnithine racemase
MSGVGLQISGAVAHVILDRPRALNIYNLEMRDGLIEAFTALAEIPEVSAVVLSANGRHFSAGADLSEFGTAGSTFAARRIRWTRDPWSPLLGLDKPVIAALHGYALGAGLEMALMCDFRLAAPDTVLGLPETKLGMLPSAGGSQTLARLVGPARAAALVMEAGNVDAAQAAALGLVQLSGDVEQEALALAHRLAVVPRALMRARLALLRAARDLPFPQGLAAERQAQRNYLLETTN